MRPTTEDAIAIWRAGLAAVDPARLVERALAREHFPPAGRFLLVGAGKASAAMARAAVRVLGADRVAGWINVPADQAGEAGPVHLHPARPAAVNEPTEAGVAGTERMLAMLRSMAADDIAIALISGGASALLTAPRPPATLAEKRDLARRLFAAGAPIAEVNLVRRALSLVKGGGLARACRGRRLLGLILSDVVGDDPVSIGSGPTVAVAADPLEVQEVLRRRGVAMADLPPAIRTVLAAPPITTPPGTAIDNRILGSTAIALDAAASEAVARGYRVLSLGAANQGDAAAEGAALAERVRGLAAGTARVCLLSGGEPTVTMPAGSTGLGGRNQHLALAALPLLRGVRDATLLAAGTDGEDGPTDAAGAYVDEAVIAAAERLGLDPRDHLARFESHRFFLAAGGLLRTGPTGTNVADLRVATVAPTSGPAPRPAS